jgi:hypothetical protein
VLNVTTLVIFSQFDAHTPLVLIGLVMLMQGLAVGLGQQAPVIGVQNSAPRADMGAATGAVTLTRMGGAAVAISIYGAVISVSMSGIKVPGVASIGALTPDQIAGLPEAARNAVSAAYGNAFEPMFLSAAALAAVGLIAALMLKPVRLPTADAKPIKAA